MISGPPFSQPALQCAPKTAAKPGSAGIVTLRNLAAEAAEAHGLS